MMSNFFKYLFPALAGIFLSLPAIADTVDNYQIYFANKMITARSELRFAGASADTIILDGNDGEAILSIFYRHCSPSYEGRRIVLRTPIDKKEVASFVFLAQPAGMSI